MRIRIPAAVTAAAALAMLTACSSAGGGAGGDGAAAGAATSAAAQAGATSPAAQGGAGQGGAGSGKTIKVCDVLSAARAAKLSGQAYTTATPENQDWTSTCAYDNDDSTIEGVNVSYSNTNADSTWQTVHTGSVSDISGLGDKAFWDNDNTLYVQVGSDLIQVNGLSSEQESVALAKPVVAALS